jgi:predicted dienelactone hydrolase
MNARRALLATGAAWALGAGVPARAAAAAPEGFEVVRHDLDWRDPQRARSVPLRLYWPAGALRSTLPLVLVSHGFGGDRHDMAWAGSRLAAQGVACLHVQHVGSDRRVWLSGPPVWVLRELRGEMARERLDRVLDLRFALDRLLAGEWGRMVDRRRIAAVGHSLGAQTALLLGGARLSSGERLRDTRISAVGAFGLAAFAGEDTERVLRSVDVPSLHATTEDDKTSMPGYAATTDDRLRWFRSMGGQARWIAVFNQGAHAIFNDAGPQDPVGAAAADLVHGFLRSFWQAEPQALAGWRARHAALVSRYETLGSLHRVPGVHT